MNTENKYKGIKQWVKSLAIVVIVIGVYKTFVTPAIVEGTSMNPTLEDGSFAFSFNVNDNTEIKRGDIVIVKEDTDYYIIKRVIGLPNETIECKDGVIYINDEPIEDYTDIETLDFDKVYIEEGHYFIMGDNRLNSKDSRKIGTVSKDQIISHNLLVIYPFSDIGIY